MTLKRHTMAHMTTASEDRIPHLTLGWRMKMALGDMKVEDMAETLGVSRATLSRWMGDKGAPPKRAYLVQWALVTGVPLTWLQTGVSTNPNDPRGVDTAGYRQLAAA